MQTLNRDCVLYLGTTTCGGKPGSAGHEVQDAETYLRWGVHQVKSDSCAAPTEHRAAMAQYALMADVFIANAEHPVFFSLCGWASWYAASGPAQGVGDSYRVGTDCVGFEQMLLNIDALAPYARLLGNGRYPDLDMVSAAATRALSGNLPPGGRGPGSLLAARVQTHFSMIAVTGSMLLLSFDVRDARNQHLIDVVGNRRIISVHQDPTRTFVDRGVGYMRRLSGTAMATSAKRLRSNSHCSAKEARWVFHRNGSDTVGAFESVARPGWCIQTNSGNAPWAKCGASQAALMPCGDTVLGETCGPIGQWRIGKDGGISSVFATAAAAGSAAMAMPSAFLTRDADNDDGVLWIEP